MFKILREKKNPEYYDVTLNMKEDTIWLGVLKQSVLGVLWHK